MQSIYELISLVGFLFIYLAIFSNLTKNRFVAILAFSLFAIIWITSLGFSGTDMPTYLNNAEKYTFTNPRFMGEPFEVFHGYLISTIKLFFSGLNGENLITIQRLIIYWLLPSFSLFFTNTYNARKSTFIVYLTNLVLFPYTFLGASNIFSNGVAMQLFLLSLVSYLNSFSVSSNKYKYLNIFNKYAAIFFLMFSAFTHKIGLWIVFCLFFSQCSRFLFKKFSLLPRNKQKLFLTRIFLLNLVPFVVVGLFLKKYASSQKFDITAPIMGLISLIFLILLLDLIKRLFQISKLSDWKIQLLKSTQLSEAIFFAFILTIPALIFTFISTSDAAERIAFASILYLSSITLYFGISKRNLKNLSRHIVFSKNYFTFDRSVFGCLIILLSLTIYFYNSNAFCSNYGICQIN